MVYAELIHNPYLLHTSVNFNGQEPKINSQIEKYENQTLKDWVHRVPQIFYDEMNGYDFDLNFTGTKPDFAEVKQAFSAAGVSQELVRLFFKNELEDADTKSQEIDTLLHWLKENHNRKFALDVFLTKHADLFESTYPYIIIRGNAPDDFNPQISMETVGSVNELKGTLLTNTPLVFFVEDSTMKQFRADLTSVLKRRDVSQQQLFFMFHPYVNVEQTERVIRDLGVDSPQIVSSFADDAVMAYLRNYPVTEYIRNAIKAFEVVVHDISVVLEAENAESEILNAEIHAEIDHLEDDITRLKLTDEFFVERDNFNTPQGFLDLLSALDTQIKKWRNRKTKVTGEYECEIAARDYDAELRKYIGNFVDGVKAEYKAACINTFQSFREKYAAQGIDKEYVPSDIFWEAPSAYALPTLITEFLALQEITFEEPKSDLFNMFLKSSAKEEKEPVRVVTCYYEHWRSRALEIIIPAVEQYIQEVTDTLRQYYDDLAEAYHVHLSELIASWTKKKESVSAQLSDDERKLQEDNDWLREVRDQLFHIERG